MIKYINTMVVFSEIPDKVTLAINLTNCWFHCDGCHSKYLWDNKGTVLDANELGNLIDANKGIECVCFMGEGSKNTYEINSLAAFIKSTYPELLVALYTGRDVIPPQLYLKVFDYIKVGPYDSSKGPLNNKNTNQVFYSVEHKRIGSILHDKTYKFWR